MASVARKYVGRNIRFRYPAPAVTCFANGRVVKMEGRVTSIRHDPTPYFGRDTMIVRRPGYEPVYARLSEITHVQDARGRWRAIKRSS